MCVCVCVYVCVCVQFDTLLEETYANVQKLGTKGQQTQAQLSTLATSLSCATNVMLVLIRCVCVCL